MMSWRKVFSIIAVLSVLVSGALLYPVRAQETSEPLVTDRPDFTESAETIPRGRVQIESGVTFDRSEDERASTFGEVLVRISTGDRSELRIGVPSYLRGRGAGEKASGFDDLFLGAKFVLKKGGGRKPQYALLVGTPVPTGSREVAERRYQPEAVLAVAFDISDRVAFSTNFGGVRASDGGERFSQAFGSASLGFGLAEKWSAYLEAYAFNRTEPGGDSQQFVNTGVTYLINNDFQLDARIGRGLNDGRETFFGFGASRRF